MIDTPIGKVGLLICWDLAFPEAFRELIAKGAEVIIVPTYCKFNPISILFYFFYHPRVFYEYRLSRKYNISSLLRIGFQSTPTNTIPTQGTKYDALPEALALNPETEVLFIDSTLTSRCFENTCAIIFANAAGPADKFMGTSRVSLPFVGAVGKMGSEEGVSVADMDLGILDLAESCYKVRQDINSEGWHYVYRHNSAAGL